LDNVAALLEPVVLPVRVVATVVVALAIPLFLLTSGVRGIALEPVFYMDEFAKYRVSLTTGLPNEELQRVAVEFTNYFRSEPGRLDVTVNTPAGPQPLFNEREIQHMVDVQGLFHQIFWVWGLSLAGLILGAIAMIVVEPATGGRALVRAAAIGGGVTALLIAFLGLASLVDFSRLFYQFHLVSFSNDLWLLDPRRDRLIQLFPQGFFFDAAIRIAVQTLVMGLVIGGVSLVTLRTMR
jgi:integral membrane protein (TIGR01906 family)